jgi:hypothetical protein
MAIVLVQYQSPMLAATKASGQVCFDSFVGTEASKNMTALAQVQCVLSLLLT